MATYTVGGSVSGLAGSGLVLQNNSGSNTAISANGSFTFSTPVASGATYNVTVSSQPTAPSQMCVVKNGDGMVSGGKVTNVAVTCTTRSYLVGVTVSGLTGTGLVLQVNGSGNLAVTGNDLFTLPTPVVSGSKYVVTVFAQPADQAGGAAQNCTVTNGTGTIESPSVAAVAVNCADISRFSYLIGSSSTGPLGVWANTINPTTGVWTVVTGSPYALGTDPLSIAVDPASVFVYVATLTPNAVSVFRIEPTSGGLTSVAGGTVALSSAPTGGGPGASAVSIAIDPGDKFAYVLTTAGLIAFTIHATTGTLTPVAGSPVAVGSTPAAVAIDPSGSFLYVANGGSNNVSAYSINSGTGALSTVSGSPFLAGTDPVAISFDKSGKFIYVQNTGSNNVSAFSINATTGALTPVPGSPFQPVPYSLMSATGNPTTSYTSGGFAVDPNSDYAFFEDGITLYFFTFTVNDTTGALTEVAVQPELNNAIGQVGSRSLQIDTSGKFACYVQTQMGEGEIGCPLIDPTTGAFSTTGGGGFSQGGGVGSFILAK
jgi:6-phosphogluconolactonase (cycloisomerase 2 family)